MEGGVLGPVSFLLFAATWLGNKIHPSDKNPEKLTFPIYNPQNYVCRTMYLIRTLSHSEKLKIRIKYTSNNTTHSGAQ